MAKRLCINELEHNEHFSLLTSTLFMVFDKECNIFDTA